MVRLLLLLLFPSVLSAQVSSTVPMGTSHTHTIVSGPSTTLTAVIAAAGAHPQTVSIYGALPVGSGGTVPATLDVDLTAGTITNTGGEVISILGQVIAPPGKRLFVSCANVSLSGNRKQGAVSIKWCGAQGDGVTNDQAAVQRTGTMVHGTGLVILVPPGTYLLGSTVNLTASNVLYQGVSPFTSVFTRSSSSGAMFSGLANTQRSDITFERLGFVNPTGQTGAAINLDDDLVRNVTIRNNRFDVTNSTGFAIKTRTSDVVIENNEFFATSRAFNGQGVIVGEDSRNIVVRNNTCRMVYACVNVSTVSATRAARDIFIRDNYSDGMMWYHDAQFTGSGGTVTYSATVVTDTAQSFSGFNVPGTFVRVLAPLESGTSTAASPGTLLTDSTATFLSAGVAIGDMVRTGETFAVVTAVVSETAVQVEGWYNLTTKVPTDAPLVGTAYTVYQYVFGESNASTGTTITVERWVVWQSGATATTPAAGTLYEVWTPWTRQSHALQVSILNAPVSNCHVTGNTLRRTYADQIAVKGAHGCIVANNTIEDGGDTGITLWGRGLVVTGNTIRHQRLVGIGPVSNSTNATSDGVIANNVIIDTPYTKNTGGGIGAGIYVQAARMLVESNVYARVNGHTDAAGYCFRVQDVSTPDTDANIFRGNTCRNAVTKDFSIETGVTNTVLENDGGASITDAGTNTRRLWFTDVFANLGSFANGSMGSCTDCTVASPCAGSGTGAFAKRQGGAWVCN